MVPAGVKALLSTVTTSQTRLQHPTRVPSVTINSASATTMDEPLFELPNFRRGSDADITIREVSPMHASSDSTETDALHPHSKDSFDVLWKVRYPTEYLAHLHNQLILLGPALPRPLPLHSSYTRPYSACFDLTGCSIATISRQSSLVLGI
jgi:hypothetical protein